MAACRSGVTLRVTASLVLARWLLGLADLGVTGVYAPTTAQLTATARFQKAAQPWRSAGPSATISSTAILPIVDCHVIPTPSAQMECFVPVAIAGRPSAHEHGRAA